MSAEPITTGAGFPVVGLGQHIEIHATIIRAGGGVLELGQLANSSHGRVRRLLNNLRVRYLLLTEHSRLRRT